MRLLSWDSLPDAMKKDDIRPYYDNLKKKSVSLIFKRLFDLVFAILCLIILSPLFLILSIWIKLDSKGPVFFRQRRVTRNMREFRIFKFRTMVSDAEKLGSQVTKEADSRITKCGHKIRKYRLDEIPQLLNIILGDMTFVGTRPEVPKYVSRYSDEMLGTLLLPAGVTSMASIKFKDEAELLLGEEDLDDAYVLKVLPKKMEYNLDELKRYSFGRDLKTILKTVVEVF